MGQLCAFSQAWESQSEATEEQEWGQWGGELTRGGILPGAVSFFSDPLSAQQQCLAQTEPLYVV